jgi:molybdopterin synthase catalytic subunit
MTTRPTIQATISDGPLAPPDHPSLPGGIGARLCFEGIVRGDEHGRAIDALEYTAYEPMARDTLVDLAADIAGKHGLSSIIVEHSRGRVPVDACSFRLTVTSPHRKEALAAMDEFIDRMKRDVPIWKAPVWRAG